MILGLLSDTHGHLPRTRQALKLLQDHGAEQLIHCGDLGSEEIITLLFEVQASGTPVIAVPGNVDEWDPGLMLYAHKLGLSLHRLQRFTCDSLRIAVFHGHDPKTMERLLAESDLDLLLTGHTHVSADETIGHLRVINPGAVYRANPPGVSVFDTRSRQCRFLPLT